MICDMIERRIGLMARRCRRRRGSRGGIRHYSDFCKPRILIAELTSEDGSWRRSGNARPGGRRRRRAVAGGAF